MSSTTGPASTTAQFVYMVPPDEGVRPYQHINADPITGDRKRNFGREEKEVTIENLRGKEDTVSLDTTGFQYYKHASKHTAFLDDDEIRAEYYPESVELVKKLTGASRVVFFDHTIRRRKPGQIDDSPQTRQPVAQVHVDQTIKSSIARVHRHLPADEVPGLLEKRFQIINLWRPIEVPALDWPLALCDYRSVNPTQDTFPVALIYPTHEGETLGVRPKKDHRWKYLHGMTPDEVVLIKCFDSVQDGSVAVFTPHTGFQDPNAPADAPPRQSIELRALVFYD
ncbi:hypothetical protein BDN70DRAFT_185671 [Pholiota conissans]|uniref:Methyltransferase n=1 Tax=Pholiota conissans TaxID=109636 RepID=A0A9P5YYD2_9AGAR|nr:hypothetical protein BDN70DRAFT_185671 [Pholiota conissans]